MIKIPYDAYLTICAFPSFQLSFQLISNQNNEAENQHWTTYDIKESNCVFIELEKPFKELKQKYLPSMSKILTLI